jgi:hypothetical protein
MPYARCFLHIGAPKTGSTMLQRVLFECREALPALGIRYSDVSLRGFGHHDIAFLIGGGYPEWATAQPKTLDELRTELASELRGWTGSVLLSSEDFYLYPNPAGVRDFLATSGALDGRDPKIVVYVRRQDDAYESWYNQTIKAQGYTHTIEECLRAFRNLFDYDRQLAEWEAVFGRDALDVRPYQRADFVDGDLLHDFLAALGLDPHAFGNSNVNVNTSLNRDLLEFQRALNALPLAIPKKRSFHRRLIELSNRTRGSGLFDERPVLGARARTELVQSYDDGNRRVAERYLSRPQLFSDSPVASDDQGPHGPASLSADKLAAIVGWLLLKDEPE